MSSNNFLDAAALQVVPPGQPIAGKVILPGSKSITNRALLLAALATGPSRLTGALKSDDTARMAEALRAMGVRIEEPTSTEFIVTPTGRLAVPPEPLFLGNAGTAMRFLTAAVATVPGTVVLDGDQHMRKRPIQPLLAALAQLGVTATSPTGCPPVTVLGGQIVGARVAVDAGLSSQYVSALLMLAAMGTDPIDVALTGAEIGARGYVSLTTAVMEAFGASVEVQSDSAWRVLPTGYKGRNFAIEPDASAATYPWAWQAITGGAIDLGVEPAAMSQPDARAYEWISAFPFMPPAVDGSQMQDAVPTLAVLAAFNSHPVRFTGIENLRVKECDRIQALSNGLNAISLGLAIVEQNDLIVYGRPNLAGPTKPVSIDTHNDHRIAMAFAIAGLRLENVVIDNPGCVAKTYPDYWQALAALGVRLTPTA